MNAAQLLQTINEHVDTLAKETDAFQKSSQFQKYLDTMAKFWEYSFRNQLLIHYRMPDASKVAGFKSWKELGRTVKKGEKAIKIIAPFTKKNDEGEDETYFFPVNVFDVSQTEGQEIDFTIRLQGNDYDWLLKKLVGLCESKKIDVEFANLGINDLYGYAKGGKVFISKKDSVNTQVNTLVHELAHEMLHFDNFEKQSHESSARLEEKPSEKFREIQAEGVSHVVCTHFGLKTKSFVYLGLKKASSEEIMHNLEVIAKTSKEIIEKVSDG